VEDRLGFELGGGVLFELFADLMDLGSESDEEVRHRVGDLLRIADDDALAVAQDDVSGDADDGGVVGNTTQDDRASADAAVVADGDIAKNLRSRADDNVIPDSRVALAVLFAGASERDALIHSDVIADDRGFTDDHGRTVIDEETVTDLRAGMNLDQREDASDLGEEAGEKAEAFIPEPVIDAVKPKRVQAWIAEQNLGVGPRGGIALADRADVVADGLEKSEQGSGLKLWLHVERIKRIAYAEGILRSSGSRSLKSWSSQRPLVTR
jgi:hypothetical protein